MMFHEDYMLCEECENEEAIVLCIKCGKCGRKFEDGIMIDDGGTTEDVANEFADKILKELESEE